jgi:hypothetical protein
MSHTPTPWTVRDCAVYMGTAGGFDLRGCPQPDANAAFIVRACNAHDELVAALGDLVGRIERDERIEMQHLTHARAALAKVTK